MLISFFTYLPSLFHPSVYSFTPLFIHLPIHPSFLVFLAYTISFFLSLLSSHVIFFFTCLPSIFYQIYLLFPFIHLYIYSPSFLPSIFSLLLPLLICSFILSFTHPCYISSFTYLSSYFHLFTHSFSFTIFSIHLWSFFFHPATYPSMHPSVYLFTPPFFQLSAIHPSIHSFTTSHLHNFFLSFFLSAIFLI